jgi:hypothetical protein
MIRTEFFLFGCKSSFTLTSIIFDEMKKSFHSTGSETWVWEKQRTRLRICIWYALKQINANFQPDDSETVWRDFASVMNTHLIHVLVVSPREVDVIETTIWSVDPVFGVIFWVVIVGILLQEFIINNLFWKGTTDGERVAHYTPLRFVSKVRMREDLAQIVNETDEVKPIIVRILLS